MNFFTAVILGIIEGITEFLPISSTAHLVLAAKLMHLAQSEFMKSFEIVIQLGAILAVVVLYGKTMLINTRIVKRTVAAFMPTAIIGFVLYKIIKGVFLENNTLILWAMAGGGIFLIIFELLHHEKADSVTQVENITYPQAIIIGLFQSLAVVPGVSRAAATIVGGLCLGLTRKTIVEFSFILAIPTMLAASSLDLMKNAHSFSQGQFAFLAVGFIVSFIVAIIGIKFLLFFVKRNNFIPFGIYRIIAALLCWLWL
jgi:undecaprenyl-diphosphatase